MSLSSQVLEHLSGLSKEQLARQDPATIARDMNANTSKISKLLWSLEHTGRLTLIRDGRNITGVASLDRVEPMQGQRLLDSPRAKERAQQPTWSLREAAANHRRLPRTPLIDRYEAAKRKAADIKADEYFDVQFRENPLAEEGLAVRDALARLDAKYQELSTQYKMTLYEYEGVKARLAANGSKSIASEISKRDADLARDAH